MNLVPATMRLGLVLLLFSTALAPAQTSIFLEEFHGGSYDNESWVTWHASWGSLPTVDLSSEAADISISSNEGSCGIAHLIDVSAFMGAEVTLSGEWGGRATPTVMGQAWVEVMLFQTESDDMTDVTGPNFLTFNTGADADIAIKHDSFGLPDTIWGPQTFEEDSINNGVTENFGGLTQTVSLPYLVIAFKVGRDGIISGLDNIHLTSDATPQSAEVVIDALGFVGDAFEVTASGMNPAKSYVLRRSIDGEAFSDVSGPFTGGSSRIFADPAPPADTSPVLYQVWEVSAP